MQGHIFYKKFTQKTLICEIRLSLCLSWGMGAEGWTEYHLSFLPACEVGRAGAGVLLACKGQGFEALRKWPRSHQIRIRAGFGTCVLSSAPFHRAARC